MYVNTYINELRVDELIHTIVRLLETSKTLMWGQLILEALGSPVSKRCFNSSCTQNLGWEACASCNNGYTDFLHSLQGYIMINKTYIICLCTQQIDANDSTKIDEDSQGTPINKMAFPSQRLGFTKQKAVALADTCCRSSVCCLSVSLQHCSKNSSRSSFVPQSSEELRPTWLFKLQHQALEMP